MDLRTAVFGEIAIHSGASVSAVDLGILLRRLLLFDRVVIRSVRLREIPYLARAFGVAGFRQLLGSGVLQLQCEFTNVITEIAENGKRVLPLFQFSFGIVDVHNREDVLAKELKVLQGIPGLKEEERKGLEQFILSKLIRPPSTFGQRLQAQIEQDIRTNKPVLHTALVQNLSKTLNFDASKIELNVDEPRERVFHVRQELENHLGITKEAAHQAISHAVLAVCNLNQRIADMEAYSAIVGFNDGDAPLLFGKLAGIVAPLNPTPLEEEFARILQIAHLPDFDTSKRIDVERVMELRASSECQEFKNWLRNTPNISDAEIANILNSFRSKAGSLVRTDTGRAFRFAATTGIGLIPIVGPIVGAAAGALDAFLLERLLPQKGVVAFLSDKYPSLFLSP